MARTTTYQTGTTVQVAPSDLLVDLNVRTDADLDPGLVTSIRDQGVLVPIVAVYTHDGSLRVRYGQRRTLAAIEAHRETVPVYVAGGDGEDSDAASIARIIAQRDENTHRRGLSTRDDIGAVAQLAAFGLSPAQIAKRARIRRDQVDAALQVAGSDLASKATDRYTDLTLDQAATLAEFEDDTETVTALVAAAQSGQFDHVAQRARDQRDERRRIEDATTTLQQAGVTVIERPDYDSPTLGLHRLTNDPETRDAISAEDHAACPGHVAWVEHGWRDLDADGQEPDWPDEPDTDDDAAWETYDQTVETIRDGLTRTQVPIPVYGCTEHRKHGHHDRWATSRDARPKAADLSPEDREAAKQARALVIAHNKAWASAETVRRDWLAIFAKAKTAPKGAGRFLANALHHDSHLLGDVGGNALAAQWLGKTHAGYGHADLSPAKAATEARCLMIALVQVLGYYEAHLTKDSWRGNGQHNAAGRYLRFLQHAGYTLAEVEEYAISDQTV